MSSDITLSAAVRSTLLSLISTTDLIERTQNRLSTGLKVASAIDDPVAFFQAKTLTDRAFDLLRKRKVLIRVLRPCRPLSRALLPSRIWFGS